MCPGLTHAEFVQLEPLLDRLLDVEPGARGPWVEMLAGEEREQALRLLALLDHAAAIELNLPVGWLHHAARIDGPGCGVRVGPYVLQRELGRGGMASVWLASSEAPGAARTVALKLPHVHWGTETAVQRLQREAAILAGLHHPSIARFLDAGVDDLGRAWLALEYVDGEPVDVFCRRRACGLEQRCALWLQAAEAVDHAHRQQVLHRDLKPANVLVTGEGQVRLLDFGIAKLLADGVGEETELTLRTGRLLTPEYASPEQWRGEPLGVASDVYSLGVMLYELLCETRPHVRGERSGRDFEHEVQSAVPIRPSEAAATPAMRDGLRGDLDAVVMKALRKPAHQRYRSVKALLDDVRRFVAGRPVHAAQETFVDHADGGSPAGHLPSRNVPLIGREVDRAAVADRLRGVRLVSLVGPAGVGKTALAMAAAHALRSEFSDGAIWVDLAPLAGAQALWTTVAHAAGIALAIGDPGDAGGDERLARALAPRHQLIVLDNCEHVLGSLVPLIEGWLDGAPGLRILATSREPLGLPAEQVYMLEPLQSPPPEADASVCEDYAAVRLLMRHVSRADQRYEFDAARLRQAAAVCRAVDGLPLALEIAGARVPKVGLTALCRMLEETPLRLPNQRRGAPARHQTLAALYDWSHSLLAPEQQRAWVLLSVFSGPFDLALAHAMWRGDGVDAWQAQQLLSALVDKSLVSVVDGEPPRYRLLEIARRFAADRAEQAGWADEGRRRHAAAMREIAERFLLLFDSVEIAQEVRLRHDLYYVEFESAFDYACSSRDADIASFMLHVLRNLDGLRGVLTRLLSRLESMQPLLPEAEGPARARILTSIASCSWLRGLPVPPLQAAREAVALWRGPPGDPGMLRYALYLQAVNAALAGHADEAEAALREADALAALETHPRRRAISLIFASHVDTHLRRWRGALDKLQAALPLLRGPMLGYVQMHLLGSARNAGEHRLVLQWADDVVAAMRAAGQREFMAHALCDAAGSALELVEVPRASTMLYELLPLAAEFDLEDDLLVLVARLALYIDHASSAATLIGRLEAIGVEAPERLMRACRDRLGPAACESERARGLAIDRPAAEALVASVLAAAAR